MESLRESLKAGLLKRIEKELGRETMVQLLWPQIVGEQLARNTQLEAIRGSTLVIAVPNRSWISSLESLQQLILDAANRIAGGKAYRLIEVIVRPRMRTPGKAPQRSKPARLPQHISGPEFDASAIADEALRKAFKDSAIKYLTRPSRTRQTA